MTTRGARLGGRLGVAVCVAVIAACSGGSDDSIEVVVFGEPQEAAAYRDVVDGFTASDPGFDVDLVVAATRSDLLTRVSTAIAAGEPPELFLVNYRFFGQFASKGALQPFDDHLAEADDFDLADVHPVPLEAFRWNGEQMCLPQNASSLAVYYNASVFDAAGVERPVSGWTWDDMVSAARSLTVDDDGDGRIDRHGLGIEPSIVRLAPFVWSAGGELFDDPDDPTRYTLDNAPALESIQRYLDLRAGDPVVPSDPELESEGLESRFLNGRLAMYLSSRRSVPQLRTITDFEWDVAALPVEREPANVLHSDAFCMTAGSSRHDEAWEFVSYALGPEGSAVLARSGRTVPSRMSVAASSDFLDPDLPPHNSQVFLDAIDHARPLPRLSTWPEIEDISDVLIEEALFDPLGGEAGELALSLVTETLDAFGRAER